MSGISRFSIVYSEEDILEMLLKLQQQSIEDQKKENAASFLIDSYEDIQKNTKVLENKSKIEEILKRYLDQITKSVLLSMGEEDCFVYQNQKTIEIDEHTREDLQKIIEVAVQFVRKTVPEIQQEQQRLLIYVNSRVSDIENDFTIRIQQVHAQANQQNKADQEKAAELPVIKKDDEQKHVIDFNPRAIENPDKSRTEIEEYEIIEPDLKKPDIFSQVEKEKREEEFLDEKYQQKFLRSKAHGIEIQSGREYNVEERLAKTDAKQTSLFSQVESKHGKKVLGDLNPSTTPSDISNNSEIDIQKHIDQLNREKEALLCQLEEDVGKKQWSIVESKFKLMGHLIKQ